MDTELLVDNRIEDGQKLIAELLREGFDVGVTFWAKSSDEGIWHLYIGSSAVDPGKVGDAYLAVYNCLRRIPDPWVSLSEIQIIPASNPIAVDAIAARDRRPGRIPVRFQGKKLGNLAVEEAYIYPRANGPMTQQELLQTLVGMAIRPTGSDLRPSTITLRDGSSIRASVTGFQVQLPDALTITTRDPATGATGQVSGDDVVNIQ